MISDKFIWLDRISSKEEFEELIRKAKEDKHGVFVPTFRLMKEGKAVGWVSIGSPAFPVCFGWLSTKDVEPREAFNAINMLENHVFLSGARGICLPVPKESPFHPLMEKMGYKLNANYDFFIKEF